MIALSLQKEVRCAPFICPACITGHFSILLKFVLWWLATLLGPQVQLCFAEMNLKRTQTRILMCSNTHARYPQLLKGVEWYPKGTSGHGVQNLESFHMIIDPKNVMIPHPKIYPTLAKYHQFTTIIDPSKKGYKIILIEKQINRWNRSQTPVWGLKLTSPPPTFLSRLVLNPKCKTEVVNNSECGHHHSISRNLTQGFIRFWVF